MRKTPVEHEVTHHQRVTPKTHRKVKVRDYKRGSGKAETPRLFSHKDDDKSHGGFDVRLGYDDGTSESGVVKSSNYLDALPKAVGFAKKQLRSITLRKMEPLNSEVK